MCKKSFEGGSKANEIKSREEEDVEEERRGLTVHRRTAGAWDFVRLTMNLKQKVKEASEQSGSLLGGT